MCANSSLMRTCVGLRRAAARLNTPSSKGTLLYPALGMRKMRLLYALHVYACICHMRICRMQHVSDYWVFTKRRYRDAWNRLVLRRVSKSHSHSVKIKVRLTRQGSVRSCARTCRHTCTRIDRRNGRGSQRRIKGGGRGKSSCPRNSWFELVHREEGQLPPLEGADPEQLVASFGGGLLFFSVCHLVALFQ